MIAMKAKHGVSLRHPGLTEIKRIKEMIEKHV